MASSVWTLEHGGQTKTFAEWGLTLPVIRYASQDADVASFRYTGVWEQADDLFAYGAAVKIRKDGVIWFVGEVVWLPIMADGQTEEMEFRVAGPWLFLEEHPFQVQWDSYNVLQAQKIFCTHIIYNAGDNGVLITTRAQMKVVLDFLLAQYPAGAKPFQYVDGDILAGVDLYAPLHEDRDLTCAQVLQQELRWHRDAVTWFDYSLDPPALHIGRQSGLAEAWVPLPTPTYNGPVATLDLHPRPDLQRPAVVVRYERRNVINGTGKYAIFVDNYPLSATGRERGAWCMSVDLLGFNKTTVRGSIVTEAVTPDSLAWWQKHEPKLQSLRFAEVSISAPARSGLRGFANMLVEGQIAPWMELDGGGAVEWERETITAIGKLQQYSGPPGAPTSIKIGEIETMELSVKLVATNAPLGDSSYETTESVEGGDPMPVGLAQYLYDQVKDVQWSGVLTLVEEEVSGLVGIGQAVNVIGGRPEWAAMRAMVQSVTEEIETGTTRIELGPPEHLGIQDLVELLKVGRRRSRWTNPAVMAGEDLDEIALGKATANTDSGMGPTQQSYLSLTPDKETVAGKYSHINLDAKGSALQMAAKDKPGKFAVAMAPAGTNKPQLILAGDEDGAAVAVGKLQVDFADILAAVPAGDARTIKLREVCVKVNGQEKKMLVLGGGPY